jgi:hypothetical protein
MTMRHRNWIALSVALFGCSGATTEGPVTTSELKSKAAADLAAGTAQGDPCADNRWYGDAECDSFCPNADTDCVPAGDPVVCAEFMEVSNGVCSRPADDPCLFQDPDCDSAPPGGAGGSSGGGVVCAMISEVSDGVCGRPADDPCIFQDPDCTTDPPPGTYDCDLSKITCQTFAPVICPDGQVSSVIDSCYGPCVDPSECAPVACTAISEVPDGVCSRPDSDPCRGQDPDCVSDPGVVCAMYIEVSDGVCSRPADDPCIFQDPDCVAN